MHVKIYQKYQINNNLPVLVTIYIVSYKILIIMILILPQTHSLRISYDLCRFPERAKNIVNAVQTYI
jgi:hypothetical protein